jgi:hypothetical protein
MFNDIIAHTIILQTKWSNYYHPKWAILLFVLLALSNNSTPSHHIVLGLEILMN